MFSSSRMPQSPGVPGRWWQGLGKVGPVCRKTCVEQDPLDMWGMGLLTSDRKSFFKRSLFEVNSISIIKLPSDPHVCCPEA